MQIVQTFFLQVGTYHTTSVLINVKPPTPGIVSRGIALEGFCSILAGLWGSGTGSTTLTENMHTIKVTKVASRRAVELGAVFLIFFSFIGNIAPQPVIKVTKLDLTIFVNAWSNIVDELKWSRI